MCIIVGVSLLASGALMAQRDLELIGSMLLLAALWMLPLRYAERLAPLPESSSPR